MGKRETTRAIRRNRWTVAARIALALAALTPAPATGTAQAPEQLTPASAAHVALLAVSEPLREAAEWERLRRHNAHL